MSFDLLAPHYRWMEFILAQNKLQRCRTAFLDEIHEPENILVLGEGNGRFLAECCRKFPRAQITCIDSSEGMLRHTRLRLQKSGLRENDVEFVCADALDWHSPAGKYDLIVTHFFLDCFRVDQLECLLAKLARAAKSDATWLLADFQTPQKGWRQFRAKVILRLMYFFFRAITRLPARELTSPDELLVQNGFILRKRHVSEWDLLHSDRWERAGPPSRKHIAREENADDRREAMVAGHVMKLAESA